MTLTPAPDRRRPSAHPTDDDLEAAVREELGWATGIDPSTIGVTVQRGVVHLDGLVVDAAQDAAARKAAVRVGGVLGIVDRRRCAPHTALDDEGLLAIVARTLRTGPGLPTGVRAAVHGGVVTLTGSTPWPAERDAAGTTVARLPGVLGVRNDIAIAARPSAEDARDRIRQALLRSATADAASIEVRVDGTEVILEGSVRSYAERQQAAIAAWSSPHVTMVRNRIHILA